MHLNGRVYDPLIGRMMAADPNVTNPSDGQAWNRYSYVGNDPLNLTDPTGYSWFSDFFNSVGSFLSSIIKAVIQIVVTAVLTVALGPYGLALAPFAVSFLAAAGGAAVVTGLSGGNLGDMLKAAAIAGATAIAFNIAGTITGHLPGGHIDPVTGRHQLPDFGSPAHIFQTASHTGIGCASSVASGGDCASGAFAAGASALAGPIIPTQNFIGRLAINVAIGGTASVIAGGKFENGAITAAFGYLFNEATANLLADEAPNGPGHTIERHVGKRPEYLQNRLANESIDAASTYWGMSEANAVTQRLFDVNQAKIDAWLANPAGGDRLIISITIPYTSSQYRPIGTVLERGATFPLPGNGARALLIRDAGSPNGFRVRTSYPTRTGLPTQDN